MNVKNVLTAALLGSACVLALSSPALAQGKAGTTLAAVKTLEICTEGPGTWHYYGTISVWNAGARDTEGFSINDCVQTKGPDGQYEDYMCFTWPDQFVVPMTEIPANTTLATAVVFEYEASSEALPPDAIRNRAHVTIRNHSGSLGFQKGPEPKATWDGSQPPPCATTPPDLGCTYTQGYWKTHPEVWLTLAGRAPDEEFYLSGETWLEVLDHAPGGQGGGNKYYVLAHQFIASFLNIASGAFAPANFASETFNVSTAFFLTTAPAACAGKGSCGTQAALAGILDSYNNGLYPGGPPHCE